MEDDLSPFKKWFKGSLSRERRKADRQDAARVSVHYWDGAAPVAHNIRNISAGGVYVLTERRWYPGTLVMLTLQKKGSSDDEADRSITVQSRVVRSGPDGVGLAFVLPESQESRTRSGSSAGENHLVTAGRKAIGKFLQSIKDSKGQSLVEFILILPVVFLLIVNVVNFGAFFYAWITVSNAARAGADYAILGGASAGSLATPSGTAVTNLITDDILSLPNRASLVVNICQNDVGATPAVTALAGTCTSIPTDPEPTGYVLLTVDVTYTYRPLIPAGFQFRNLNVFATIPATTIHRRAVMRELR
ncbi:MAG: TadE/TadG family type IV pilus assembly protein [Acidobacteriaceae bacterium]